MGLYEDTVFPWAAEFVMADPRVEALRRELLVHARGRVLEIGMGSGLNLACYPPAVERVVGIDPNPGMNRRASARARHASFPVEVRALAGESLPIDDGSFDTVVCTFVLCTIDDVAAALGEMRRALAPGGRLLVLEHGLHHEPSVQRWQRRLNPIQQAVACGCRLDRDIDGLVERAGFTFDWLDRRQVAGVPGTHGALYIGHARVA